MQGISLAFLRKSDISFAKHAWSSTRPFYFLQNTANTICGKAHYFSMGFFCATSSRSSLWPMAPCPSRTHRVKQCVFYFFCLVLNDFVVPHLRICGVVKVTTRNHINSIPNQKELFGRTRASTEIEIRKLCFVNSFIYFCFRYEFFKHSIGPKCGKDAYENGRASTTFRKWSEFACGGGTDCSWRFKVLHIIVDREKLSRISGRRNACPLCNKIRGKRHHALHTHSYAACIFHWLCFSHFLHGWIDPGPFSRTAIL